MVAAVLAVEIGCSTMVDDIAGQDSHVSGSAVVQHCSTEPLDPASLHSLLAHAEAGLDSVASVSGWQAIPVDFVLRYPDLEDWVHHTMAHVELGGSTLVASMMADRMVGRVVHKVERPAECRNMAVVDGVIRKAEPGQVEQEHEQAMPSVLFVWLE